MCFFCVCRYTVFLWNRDLEVSLLGRRVYFKVLIDTAKLPIILPTFSSM